MIKKAKKTEGFNLKKKKSQKNVILMLFKI